MDQAENQGLQMILNKNIQILSDDNELDVSKIKNELCEQEIDVNKRI